MSRGKLIFSRKYECWKFFLICLCQLYCDNVAVDSLPVRAAVQGIKLFAWCGGPEKFSVQLQWWLWPFLVWPLIGANSVIQHSSILFFSLTGPGQNYHFVFRVLCERFRRALQNLTLCLIIYRAQFIFNCRHTNPGKKSSIFLESFFYCLCLSSPNYWKKCSQM